MIDYSKIFKAYDIRGIYPSQLDEPFCLRLGYVLGQKFAQSDYAHLGFYIWSDVRLHNNSLLKYLISGMVQGWYTNIVTSKAVSVGIDEGFEFGICSTSFNYFIGRDDFGMGVSFTASHNPSEYAGMKFFDHQGMPIATDILKNLYDSYTGPELEYVANFDQIKHFKYEFCAQKVANFQKILTARFGHIVKPITVAVDFANGAATNLEYKMLQHIADTYSHIHFYYLNTIPDGNFPNHLADPLEYHNYDQLRDFMQQYQCDFWVMFDWDADRIGFIDTQGTMILGDTITAIIADEFARSWAQDPILYDLRSTKYIAEIAKEYNIPAYPTRVGHKFIKEAMQETGAIFAGEVSGHFYFKEVGGFEFSLLALYYVMQVLDKYENFQVMCRNFVKYIKSPEINFIIKDKTGAIKKIESDFADAHFAYMDGITVKTDDYRFNVRASNTEDLLRFNGEANTQQWYDEMLYKVNHSINSCQ